MIRTQIQLTERQSKGIKNMARKKKVSFAEVIRRAVDRTLESDMVLDEDELWQRAREVVGAFNSGKNDIARRHDDYLAEAYLE